MFIKCLLLLFVLSFVEAEYSYFRRTTSQCPIPRIKNGRARLRQRGTFVKFTCNARYNLVGNKYATCAFREWDVPPPVCVKSGCPQLQEVKNAVNMTSHNEAWVVFFCLPGHQLVGSPAIYCDGLQWNSTAPACIDTSVKHDETSCDFEQPDICGWKPDEYHDFDWRRLNQKTPSSFLQTGPSYDHTYGKNESGYYMYVESTGRVVNDTARLISPVFEADLVKNGCFVFWYHMYGRSMGGLRVFQKPDSMPLNQLLLPMVAPNFTLFQQWGDQGNEWYSAAVMLLDVGDNFQIVIEGIRGESFMSDVAIDDVSIQHGENCSRAITQATTPPPVLQESCVGRCDLFNEATADRGCSCSIICVVHHNCCPDILDVCEFDNKDTPETTPDDYTSANRSVAPPQTQKLVATTTELPQPQPPTSTSSTSTTTTTTSSTTTTTRRPIVRTTTTTTTPKKATTRTTTTSTTTKRPTPSTIASTTTTISPRVYTRPAPKKTTTSTTSTTFKPFFTRKSTTLTIEVSPALSTSTIFFVRTTIHDDGIKPKNEKTAEKGIHDKIVTKKAGGMSGGIVATIVLLVAVMCCGALWIAYNKARTRGVGALARLRGRATSDPEVHYLKSDVDLDDE